MDDKVIQRGNSKKKYRYLERENHKFEPIEMQENRKRSELDEILRTKKDFFDEVMVRAREREREREREGERVNRRTVGCVGGARCGKTQK